MKNLPDEELFGKLKVRLQNFEEDPDDDVWQNIEAVVRPASPQTRNRFALIVMLMLLSLGREFLLREDRAISPSFQTVTGDDLAADSQSGKGSMEVSSGKSRSFPADTLSGANTISEPPSGNTIESTGVSTASTRRTMGDTPLQAFATRKEHTSGSNDDPFGETMIQTSSAPGEGSGELGFRQPITAGELIHGQAVSADVATLQESMASSQTVSSEINTPSGSDTLTAFAITTPDSVLYLKTIVVAKEQLRARRLRVYGLLTPSMTFHHVNPSTSDDVMFQKLNSPGVLSSERFSISAEGGVLFPLANRLQVFTGLTYYHQSMDLSVEQLMPGVTNIPSRNSLDFNFQPNTSATTINYRMQNIGIVAGMSYVISVGQIVHHLGGALQYEYGIIGRDGENDNASSPNFLNFRIFYRAEYGLNERLSIFVQPTFTRSLLSDDVMNASLRVKQSRAGIGFGFLYRLK